jgi:RNA polymerase sigma-70 factor, ECF subfamily
MVVAVCIVAVRTIGVGNIRGGDLFWRGLGLGDHAHSLTHRSASQPEGGRPASLRDFLRTLRNRKPPPCVCGVTMYGTQGMDGAQQLAPGQHREPSPGTFGEHMQADVVGTDEHFMALVSEEHAGLVAASALIVGSRDVAEEIVQDSLERTYMRWNKVSRMDRPGAWVRRVVINGSISAARRNGSERRAVGLLRSRRVALAEHPDRDLADIWAVVSRLPDNQATAVALHYGADLTLAAVATEMNLTQSAVKALLHRARTSLRQDRSIKEMAQ